MKCYEHTETMIPLEVQIWELITIQKW